MRPLVNAKWDLFLCAALSHRVGVIPISQSVPGRDPASKSQQSSLSGAHKGVIGLTRKKHMHCR